MQTNIKPDYIRRVYTIKKQYESYLPLSDKEIKNIEELDRIKEVHLSNKVEGNTYTYDETYVLLEKNIPSSSRTLKEAFEIDNLNKAIRYCNDYKGDLTECFIKTCHRLVSQNCLDDYKDVGEYRTVRNWVGDINTCPPNGITKAMNELLEWYERNKNSLDPIQLAVRFKYRFVCIHPFIDGNGRVSRLLLNWILKRNGICQCSIYSDLINDYYKSLSESNKEKGSDNGKFTCSALEKFVCKCLVRKYEEYIKMLENDFE